MKKKSIFLLLPLFIAIALVTASVCVAEPYGREGREKGPEFGPGQGMGHGSHHQFGSGGHGPGLKGPMGAGGQWGREGQYRHGGG